jgi:hypothetical protein
MRRPDLDAVSTKIGRVDAAPLAGRLLRGAGCRLAHTARVARQRERIVHLLERPWRSSITDATWLHDAGYRPWLASTRLHSLDGARWSRDHGWPIETSRLVARHTAPCVEAQPRCVDADLAAELEPPLAPVAAPLMWADQTSSPAGERCTVERRLADGLGRSAAGSVVHRATVASLPALREAACEIEPLPAQTAGAS